MDQPHLTNSSATPFAARATRSDGWTPDRQRRFLEAIAEGHTVGDACALVGLSPASAYALRRRAVGASFRLGWDAASLLARDRIADTLLARAIDGQTETYTRGDTVFTRHRYDNRLAAAMLARLDKRADETPGPVHQAARLVAQEFDAFLDMVERDDGPARTGLFLGARAASDSAAWADIDPVLALARADRYLRGGAGMANEVAVADLDPAHRSDWTADQWARAEAAGLIVIADPDMDADDVPDCDDEDDDGVELDAIDLNNEEWRALHKVLNEKAASRDRDVCSDYSADGFDPMKHYAGTVLASQLSQLKASGAWDAAGRQRVSDDDIRHSIVTNDPREADEGGASSAETDATSLQMQKNGPTAPDGYGQPTIRRL